MELASFLRACSVHHRRLERFDDALAGDRWRILHVVATDAAIPIGVEARAQANLLRDIFNPVHPGVVDTSWLAWNNGTVVKLARAIYEERGRKCPRCDTIPRMFLGGRTRDPESEDLIPCTACGGEGRVDVGLLDPDRLPILADALEEAGCDNADILGHLRGPGPHWRGCWPLDLLLADLSRRPLQLRNDSPFPLLCCLPRSA
jgi:hypothetical protein